MAAGLALVGSLSLFAAACDGAAPDDAVTELEERCGLLANGVFVYLEDDAPRREILELKDKIVGRADVARVRYLTKQEVYEEFRKLSEDWDGGQDSPSPGTLPGQIRVRATDPEAADRVAAAVQDSPIVFNVALGRQRPGCDQP